MQSLQSSRKAPKKKWFISLAVVLLLAAIAAASLYAMKLGPFAEQNTRPDTTKSQDKNDDKVIVDEPDIDEPSSNSAKNPDKSDDPSQSNDKDVQITAAYINGDTFQVRTLIPTITTSGTCTLTMSAPGQETYTATAGVQALSSSSTCQGFDVPMSSLGSGTWKISVTYTGTASSSTATKEVVINA